MTPWLTASRPTTRRLEFLHTTAFRWVIASASVFAGAFALMFIFIYWQSAGQMRQQFDGLLSANMTTLAEQRSAELPPHIASYLRDDPRRMTSAGLFNPGGQLLAGNLREIPPGLTRLGEIETTTIHRVGGNPAQETERARAIAQRLPDGNLLVLARNMDLLQELTRVVIRALLLGAAPAVLLALAGGVLVSLGTVRRIEAIHTASRRIMAGQLGHRLPLSKGNDDFDRLAGIVNVMLDEIERLMNEVKAAGDSIAHDLRTPLARLRARLERARDDERRTAEDLRTDVDGAINQLDELIHVMQALLRLGAIEQGQRQASFAVVDLTNIANEVGELYAPLAEDEGVALSVRAADGSSVLGDRDLLFEAMVNLVDNAVKFTPAGGQVRLEVLRADGAAAIVVTDDGPGIPEHERQAVLKRFFRSDRSRNKPGTGLGLSLVAAVARLHGGQLAIESGSDGKGCRITLGFSANQQAKSAA
jgi:signal transduction histidine kinase